MTALHRTTLTAAQKVQCAAAAVSGQHQHGSTTALSRRYEISRPTVYAAGATAQRLLEGHFESSLLGGESVVVRVDEAQLLRALVALRAMAPNSLRAIEDLLPLLYPGVAISYGKIQSLLVEAEGRARGFNADADLSEIEAGALDEMFSQGAPVLAGVDLDGGYLFSLALNETRSGADWAELLRAGKAQGLELSVVVKDAARGIAAGVREVFPDAEQRDDCFHALYEMNKVRRRLEQRAYGAIGEEMEAEAKLGAVRAVERERRDKLRRQWVWQQRCCLEAIGQLDGFEAAMAQVREAMEYVDLDTGALRSAEEVPRLIKEAAQQMLALGERRASKVARYVENRAPGLALAMGALRPQLDALGMDYGEGAVALGGVIWRLVGRLSKGRRRGPWREHQRHLLGAYARLREQLGVRTDALLEAIKALLDKHHRASSAIEGFNAALRPYLYVHKGVTQGFLDLFRAYFNLRTRRWGRHKGTSAHQSLSGERVADWLTVLGYPPSPALS